MPTTCPAVCGSARGRCAALPDLGPQGSRVQCQHYRKSRRPLLHPLHGERAGQELFCLDLGTPDRLSAELVKKQFILKGNEIYQMLITKLTEEEK